MWYRFTYLTETLRGLFFLFTLLCVVFYTKNKS
jgi:hypothetical protein